MTNQRKVLSIFSLTMITVGSVDSIRNLPATALLGSELVFFFILGALFFLIPAALVSAELASGWPKQGGVYVWVREAFGKKVGLLAIWLQWISNVIWYPAILSFVAGSIGYVINPALASNPWFLWSVITSTFWGTTFLNLYGMRSSAMMSNICALSGLLLPMALIIGLGVVWLVSGSPMQVHLDAQHMVPHWSDHGLWSTLTAIILSFCGIEIATVHANDVNEPQRAFPRALFYSVVIILSTLVLGSLTIAVILPHSDINLTAGIMQVFDVFLGKYHLSALLPLMALMLILGGLGSVNNWIIGPTKGLLAAADDGYLPLSFQKTNEHGAPTTLLILQAVIVTLLSGMFLLMPSVNGSYWWLTALAAQLYMLMYLLLFIAGIALRLTAPDQPRVFRIPGKHGMTLVSGIGIIGVLVTLWISFTAPEGIDVGNLFYYGLSLVLGLALMSAPPFVFAWLSSTRRTVTSGRPILDAD